jgi:thiol-disulfide isomerase/thioredoxin
VAQGSGDRLAGLDGGSLTLADLEGRDSIVVFWASWSPKCRDIVERLNRLHSQWSGSAAVVSVNFQEDAAEIRDFLRGQNLRPPVYLDLQGAFSRKHAVTDLPGLVIYRDGKVAYQGRMPQDVDSVIRRVLS